MEQTSCDADAIIWEVTPMSTRRRRILGTAQRATPITYVTKDDPSFLIVEGGGHGGFQDPNVEQLVVEFFARQFNPIPR